MRQTSTIKAGAMPNVNSPRANFASTTASGSCWLIARAAGLLATTSGSTPILPPLLSLVYRPIEDALLPYVEVAAQNDEDEQQHFKKPKKFQLTINNSPGIKKNR